MANQNNYPERLTSLQNQRPSRYTSKDLSRIYLHDSQALFGTSVADNIEIWFYSPSGEVVKSTRIHPEDEAISLTSLVDTVGVVEYLNVELATIAERLELSPGRYAVTMNFLRDEVGSLDGYKLKIDELSSDRKEVRFSIIQPSPERLNDLFEFITPSVPKLYAQGLTDQLFGKNLDIIPGEQISPDRIMRRITEFVPRIDERIVNASAYADFENLVEKIKDGAYKKAIQFMAEDVNNPAIQQVDLELYLDKAIVETLTELMVSNQIDARFQIV